MATITGKSDIHYNQIRPDCLKAGISGVFPTKKPYIKNSRDGGVYGNRAMIRENFIAASIAPRNLSSFRRLQAFDLLDSAYLPELKEKLNISYVEIPDPTDTTWLREQNRLIRLYRAQGMSEPAIKRELEVNKPLGRDQRTRRVPTNKYNFDQKLDENQKIRELKRLIENGQVQGQAGLNAVSQQIMQILNDTTSLYALSQQSFENVTKLIKSLSPAQQWEDVFNARIVDKAFWAANKGIIISFILGTLPDGGDPNNPVSSLNINTGRYNPINIPRLNQLMVREAKSPENERYYDLETRRVETRASLARKGLTRYIPGFAVRVVVNPAQAPAPPPAPPTP